MARFIPIDKMKKLREASRNGDERAKKILAMQLGGVDDFSSDLEDYFKPQPQIEETTTGAMRNNEDNDKGLMEFLRFNGVSKENPEYNSYVEDYYKENPRQNRPFKSNMGDSDCDILGNLISDEIEAIENYNKAIMCVMRDENVSETEMKGMITELEDIKREEIKHLETLKRLKSSKTKKQEKEITELNINRM
jgi:hypothetical protein